MRYDVMYRKDPQGHWFWERNVQSGEAFDRRNQLVDGGWLVVMYKRPKRA